MRTAILIPARYNSTRLPGKMLEVFDGVPLIKRVYNSCVDTGLDTFVLTDNSQIKELFGDAAIMTSEKCENGTDRCASVCDNLDYDVFINVQGDMIDIDPETILSLAKSPLLEYNTVVTAHTEMMLPEILDPNSVKLIQTNNRAHWFCRASLTYGYKHLGIYMYPKHLLVLYPKLTKFTEEVMEGLEQLRWLQNGIPIYSQYVEYNGMEINSPKDAETWKNKNLPYNKS